ncbi:MAG: PEPxxWA-CTERM sorting domain-containing protein [Pseudomonadota bacterium]
MRATLKITVMAGAMAFAAPAIAQAVNAPTSSAFTNAFGSNIGQVQTKIVNGVTSDTYNQASGGSSSTSHSADNYFNQAQVGSDINTAMASSDLANGALHGYVGIGNFQSYAPRAFSQASIADTLFFNNGSGATVFLPYSFRFDGSITPTGNFVSNATAALYLTGGAFACPDGNYGTCNGDTSLKLASGTNANMTTVIGYASDGSNNAVQQGGAFFFNGGDNTDLSNYSVFKNWNNATGVFDTIVSATLAIPTGMSRLGYKLDLSIDCSQPGSVCDFSNTSKFGFDPLPTGLTVSSASGVFQTSAVNPPVPGAVPEPATWAMMLTGFGLVGVSMRSRKPRPSTRFA